MLERLSGNEYYCFLDGFSAYFQIPLALEDQEKTTFTCLDGTFAYRRMPFGLCNSPATFQRCMTAIFHDMCKDFIEVFMDDFSVFGNSFGTCLSNLSKMLARCEKTNLVLNWEKCHFMVKKGIVLGHKISKAGIEVDKAKVDVIASLPYPTNVKGIRSFLGHAGFYRRFIKDFSKIAHPMTQLLMKDAKFDFSDECIKSFDILQDKLITAPGKDMDEMRKEPGISEENEVNVVIKEDREMDNNGVCMDEVEDVRNVNGGNIDMINPESYANKLSNDIQLDEVFYVPPAFNDKGEDVVLFDEELVKEGVNELRYNIRRMWGRFGLKDIIVDDEGICYLKFRHEDGMNSIIDQSSWLVNGKPLIV
ncbi:reverse transcriptase domain-containing protein [Tanacetum coccineum]